MTEVEKEKQIGEFKKSQLDIQDKIKTIKKLAKKAPTKAVKKVIKK